jgi:catechol-2,3-dioxygenase
MARLPRPELTHLGLYTRDLDLMTAFYTRTFGMVTTDSGEHDGRRFSFLSAKADEHHQLVLTTGRTAPRDARLIGQLAFRLETLEELRQFYAYLAAEGAKDLEGRDHGNSWSLYFLDPEGNKIEVYVPTPWSVSQPWRAPLDLTQPSETIYAATKELMRRNPTSRPIAEWQSDMRAKLQD